MKRHMFTIIVGLIIVGILVLYMVTFTVRWQEKALVLTFGKISRIEMEPGLKWKLPWQWTVVKFDGRIRTLDQQTKQTATRDKSNIISTVYINWRIVDPQRFYESFRKGSSMGEDVVYEAEKSIRSWLADATNIFAEYNLGELVTLDEDKFKLSVLEKGTPEAPGGMLGRIREKSQTKGGYGLEIVDLGIKQLGIPDPVTEKVFERMREDRNAVVSTLMAEGDSQAKIIKGEADSERKKIIAAAEAEAKKIKGQGDAAAAQYYAIALKHPELANYFRKLETLRKTLSERTTIILDQHTPPYEMMLKSPGLDNMGDNKGQ